LPEIVAITSGDQQSPGVIADRTIYNTFNVCRHLTTASTHRILRSQAFDAWKSAVATPA
jgi:hypothetical protein